MSGGAGPMGWVGALPSEVAMVRAGRGPVARAGMADVEAYAAGDYLVDILHGTGDLAATERLTAHVAGLTGLDPALVRRMGGRLDLGTFQRSLKPGSIVSIYDGTVSRPTPAPRAFSGQFPDPVLAGLVAPVTTAMKVRQAARPKRFRLTLRESRGTDGEAVSGGRNTSVKFRTAGCPGKMDRFL
jgi:hypothetical protein